MNFSVLRGTTMQLTDMCQEVQSVARGDERDGDEIQSHLAQCAACRLEIDEFRSLAQLARAATAIDPASSRFRSETVRRARGRSMFGSPLQAALLTAAAVTAAVAISWQLAPPPQSAQLPIRMTIEPAPTSESGLQLEVSGPFGSQRSRVLPETRFVLETVAANAMVIDTF